eukprot:EG_transcript_34519
MTPRRVLQALGCGSMEISLEKKSWMTHSMTLFLSNFLLHLKRDFRFPQDIHEGKSPALQQKAPATYKALKETEVKPGQWVAILGACGGLGHVGVQYAKAMGMKVCAVDFGEERGNYALKTLGCRS